MRDALIRLVGSALLALWDVLDCLRTAARAICDVAPYLGASLLGGLVHRALDAWRRDRHEHR